MRLGLERIQALMERLGHPERAYPVIHVAGTNGKGSVAAMVTEALMASGLRVGLNISPDLGKINERVMINREPLSEDLWDAYGEEVEEAGRDMSDVPTFFEAVTALAFLAFQRQAVDVAVIEVGLGGRLDATNVVPSPLLAIITPVALDHMDRLGSTPAAIASEKAGILKPGTELVLAQQPFPEAREVIMKRAKALSIPVFEAAPRARMTAAGPVLTTDGGLRVSVPLQGVYQRANLDTAWMAIERLAARGWISHLNRAAAGLARVTWPGRFQVVSENPLIVVDGAHNLHGIDGLRATLEQDPWRKTRWHLLFGWLSDKPGQEMLQRLLPKVTDVVLTRVPGDRGIDPGVVLSEIPHQYRPVVAEPLQTAWHRVLARIDGPKDGVLVAGSLSLLMHLNQAGLLPYSSPIRVER
nr:folylpolyglutamate synthase/dihydrofolate synthase family protein [Sulfobacillus harzensis]